MPRPETTYGCATYDDCYRRKAAVAKSLDWGHVDLTLYSEMFTGQTKEMPRCCYCMIEYHSSVDCTYAPDNLTWRLALPSNSWFNISQQRVPLRSAIYLTQSPEINVGSSPADLAISVVSVVDHTQELIAAWQGPLHLKFLNKRTVGSGNNLLQTSPW